MINYSIIIPHKNIPELLQRCLDSIPEREDIQIVIVDDNSDPDKVDFNAFPGLNRKNTEVYFTKEGKGAGYARNVGLRYAKGKWLLFADADDFFMPCFNRVLDIYKNDESDVIYFHSTSVDSDTMQSCNRNAGVETILSKIIRTGNWDIAIVICPPWAKFIKRDIVNRYNIKFQEIQYSNDLYFSMLLAIIKATKSISDYAFYCVTRRDGSITKSNTPISSQVKCHAVFDADCHLKSIGKKQYFYYHTVYWWLKNYRANKTICIPIYKIYRQYGVFYLAKAILKLIYTNIHKKE
jgi:glycosyltransferase involved in cell wall biosynthesis